jgi:hypothetical protein
MPHNSKIEPKINSRRLRQKADKFLQYAASWVQAAQDILDKDEDSIPEAFMVYNLMKSFRFLQSRFKEKP